MRHPKREDFRWKGNDLLFEGKIFMGVFPNKDHKNMWHVEYPNMFLSQDFYNKTRAKEHCINEAIEIKARAWGSDEEEEPLEAPYSDLNAK